MTSNNNIISRSWLARRDLCPGGRAISQNFGARRGMDRRYYDVTQKITLSSRDDVELALRSATLVPPPRPETLQPGPTADLRDTMARFSSGESHDRRRVDVVAAAERLDTRELESIAFHHTLAVAAGDRIDAVADIANSVPTEALAEALGAGGETELLADTKIMVGVIGRGEPSSAASDRAVRRLLDLFRLHPAGSVQVLSLLYQNHDATAALAAATILARSSGESRRSAIERTIRLASVDTPLGESTIAAGTLVTLDLESSRFEFGAGQRQCPGQILAEAIVRGIIEALTAQNYRLLAKLVEYAPDGRPSALPMEVSSD